MGTPVYLIAACLMLLGSFIVFRILVRRDYQSRGRLAPLTSVLELAIWLLFVCFPYLYNPADWWLVGFADTPANPIHKIIGSALVVVGMAVALVAMSGAILSSRLKTPASANSWGFFVEARRMRIRESCQC